MKFYDIKNSLSKFLPIMSAFKSCPGEHQMNPQAEQLERLKVY